MKYLIVIVMALFLLSGCTKQTDDDKRKLEIKKSADSLKAAQEKLGESLDSLDKESRQQDEKLKQMKIELDSLNKRIEQQKK